MVLVKVGVRTSIFVQREMRAGAIIIAEISFQYPSEMVFTENSQASRPPGASFRQTTASERAAAAEDRGQGTVYEVGAHGLRGTHSTSLSQEAGATSHLVAQQLGHENPKTTLEHYTRPGVVERQNQKRVLRVLEGGRNDREKKSWGKVDEKTFPQAPIGEP